MTLTVHYAVSLPANHRPAPYGLPEGFPYVVIEESSKIIEPILLYQVGLRLVGAHKNWSKRSVNTTEAEAFDLRDRFDYLAHVEWADPLTGTLSQGKPWDLANESDYKTWSIVLQESISPKTSRPLMDKTISRRQGAVERFYRTAEKSGWYAGEFLTTKIKKGRYIPVTSLEFAPTYSRNADVSVSPYRVDVDPPAPVRPLTAREWALIKVELGPLPSQNKNDPRPCRDRLVGEISVTAGPRVEEIASLTEFHLFALHKEWLLADDLDREVGMFTLPITKTKGLRPRDILIPGYLVEEIMHYYTGERKAAIDAGRKYALENNLRFKEPTTIFVNHSNANHNAGKTVRAATLSLAFKNACIAAAITKRVEKTDIDTDLPYIEVRAKHRFHDLRHTFAVWKYSSEVKNGNPEPWKEIQILLGHKTLQITLNTYLAVVNVDRQRPGGAQYAAKKILGEGNA